MSKKTTFVYVTYIRTTPAKLWEALTNPKFTRAYWSGTVMDSKWTRGSTWKMVQPSGVVSDAGTILEAKKPSRLVIKWRNEFWPELKKEGHSRCIFDIEPYGEMTKLSVTHEVNKPKSKLVKAVSGGWPKILSSMKSYLETGKPFDVACK